MTIAQIHPVAKKLLGGVVIAGGQKQMLERTDETGDYAFSADGTPFSRQNLIDMSETGGYSRRAETLYAVKTCVRGVTQWQLCEAHIPGAVKLEPLPERKPTPAPAQEPWVPLALRPLEVVNPGGRGRAA